MQVLALGMDLPSVATLVLISDYVLRPLAWPGFTPGINGSMGLVQLVFSGMGRSVKIFTEKSKCCVNAVTVVIRYHDRTTSSIGPLYGLCPRGLASVTLLSSRSLAIASCGGFSTRVPDVSIRLSARHCKGPCFPRADPGRA